MAIKFYMDEHVHPGITKALQQHGVDVLTTQEAGDLDVDDDEHLQFADTKEHPCDKSLKA